MKITIIGAGNVGATTAQILSEKELGDIILLDVVEDMPQGKALDLKQASPIYNYYGNIYGTNSYDDTAKSDMVIVTSGLPRKPGMTREDLVKINGDIVKSVVEQTVKKSPDAIIIMVSNPLDAMTYIAYKVSGFPKERIMGMAGVLDSSRLKTFIAMELNVSVENIQAFVLGGHGDTMIPMIRYTNVAGIPVTELIPKDKLDAIIQRTRDGGVEIVNLLKKGSAFYAPASSVVEMVDAILRDKKKILPCTVLCKGEYGLNDIFLGLPVKLGRKGVEQIIEITLTKEESDGLNNSANAVRELCHTVQL
ncbi:MAG: malate dehydrogenase [Candidatus Scalindua sp.]|nr:malate dehydrogenase [Candidatus Scalindua sp.]